MDRGISTISSSNILSVGSPLPERGRGKTKKECKF